MSVYSTIITHRQVVRHTYQVCVIKRFHVSSGSFRGRSGNPRGSNGKLSFKYRKLLLYELPRASTSSHTLPPAFNSFNIVPRNYVLQLLFTAVTTPNPGPIPTRNRLGSYFLLTIRLVRFGKTRGRCAGENQYRACTGRSGSPEFKTLMSPTCGV